MSEKEKIYTVQELAKMYHAHVVTIGRWLAEGVFPGAYRAGARKKGRWLIPQSSVDSFDAAHA